jgi:hypothetical protein
MAGKSGNVFTSIVYVNYDIPSVLYQQEHADEGPQKECGILEEVTG